MARKYHIVVSKTPEENAKWQIQFGDYDKETSQEEMKDMKEQMAFGHWPKGTKFKVVTIPGDKKKDIDAALNKMNGI